MGWGRIGGRLLLGKKIVQDKRHADGFQKVLIVLGAFCFLNEFPVQGLLFLPAHRLGGGVGGCSIGLPGLTEDLIFGGRGVGGVGVAPRV